MRILGKVLYWLAVVVVSVALLVVLVLFFESRDESEVGSQSEPRGTAVSRSD
jgi:hypothetical protein